MLWTNAIVILCLINFDLATNGYILDTTFSDTIKYKKKESNGLQKAMLNTIETRFITKNNTRIVTQRGGQALLPCVVVMSSSPATVSWFRRKDFQVLTIGLSTYSSDDRFLVEHTRHLGNWALRIKNAGKNDEGFYECQISTHPPQSVFIDLKIVEAIAEIIESPEMHINEGSTLKLECKLKRATESPLYVFWYHESRMVNYDTEDGIAVSSNKQLSLSSSILTVSNATIRNGGNYTCAPANARQSSIFVHVLKGEKPAAMQHPNKSSISIQYFINEKLLEILLCIRIIKIYINIFI